MAPNALDREVTPSKELEFHALRIVCLRASMRPRQGELPVIMDYFIGQTLSD
jgi:hypothetical protein